MSIEDHLLDLVKGVKAMTETVMQTVEKVTEEIKRDRKQEEKNKKDGEWVSVVVNDLPDNAVFRLGENSYQIMGGIRLIIGLENGDYIHCVRADAVAGIQVIYLDTRRKVLVWKSKQDS